MSERLAKLKREGESVREEEEEEEEEEKEEQQVKGPKVCVLRTKASTHADINEHYLVHLIIANPITPVARQDP
jgi:hypothetical protein